MPIKFIAEDVTIGVTRWPNRKSKCLYKMVGNVGTPLAYFRSDEAAAEFEKFLGEAKVEGVVVKNYQAKFLLGGQPMPLMAGKFVSEKFKEVHRGSWGKEHTGEGKWETFKDSFKTEARWQKAIQHFEEAGKLTNTPQDIGGLLKAIKDDIAEEEREVIKEFLWKEFGVEVLRHATIGFPEWYKERLMERSF